MWKSVRMNNKYHAHIVYPVGYTAKAHVEFPVAIDEDGNIVSSPIGPEAELVPVYIVCRHPDAPYAYKKRLDLYAWAFNPKKDEPKLEILTEPIGWMTFRWHWSDGMPYIHIDFGDLQIYIWYNARENKWYTQYED